jgi:phosphoribosylformimino-5-aminoimidazole carboxamide ribonucleotide (ProFAR) isomerase
MSEVFAAKANRDAERDAAVLATRDASVELAGGIRKLAAVEAEMLVQITRMAAEAAGTRR